MSSSPMQRTRFRYQAGDKVIVTLPGSQERAGIIQTQVQDPTKKPYVVRYDATLDDPRPSPTDGFFDEHQLRWNLSPAFTVVFEEGARDVYDRVVNRLEAVQNRYVALAASPEQAAERRAKASQMADSFWRSLVLLVMRASAYDGVLHIGPDSYAGDCLSLLFRYARSGFEGGLIFHGERTGPGGQRHPLLGEWSLHS
jgi:hypothetical protein